MSNKNLLEEFYEDFSMLLEAGFIACKDFKEDAAKKLFFAANTLNPESSSPILGIGFIHLNKLENKEARDIFERIVTREPANSLAQLFLGISYLMDKKKQKDALDIIKHAMKNSNDPTIQNLGKISLKWYEKDLKDKKAPFKN